MSITPGVIRCYMMIMFCCISCKENSQNNDLEIYGEEVINYFFETAFHTDDGQVLEEAYRWTGNIPISLHGTLWENDSLFVVNAIQEINNLGLPISLNMALDSKKSRLKVHFRNNKSLSDSIRYEKIKRNVNSVDSFSGKGRLELSNFGEILTGEIDIFNNSFIYDDLDSIQSLIFRKGLILEEIFQALGIPGDSFTYYNSTIYEGKNKTDSLSALDKEILKFLYNNHGFKKRIKRVEFEQEYANVLYNNLTTEKLKKLSSDYGLDKRDLNNLGKIIFSGNNDKVFLKFPRNIFYKIKGNYTSEDVAFFKLLITELNNVVPHLKGEFANENSIWNESPSLTINFNCAKDSEVGATVISNYSVSASNMMKVYRSKGSTKIESCDRNIMYKNKLITLAVLKGLGLHVTNGDLLNDTSLSNLKVNEKYVNYLQFLHDPRFPSGISEMKYERLIKELVEKYTLFDRKGTSGSNIFYKISGAIVGQ